MTSLRDESTPKCDLCEDKKSLNELLYYAEYNLHICRDCVEYAAEVASPRSATENTDDVNHTS